MNELTIMLPAYNEQDNLKELTKEWQKHAAEIKNRYGYDLKIVVVNDGSKDNTKEIAEELEKKYHNFTLINHERNKGLGDAIETGIFYIVKNRPDSVFTCLMDCDNTHNPKYIFDMLKKQAESNADVVIASRYQRGAEIKGVPPIRLLTSEGARYVYALLLGVKNVRDYTCGYRLYKNKILSKAYARFGSDLIGESGFACMAELLYKLHVCGAVFAEVPFELRYDLKRGQSKMNVFKTAKDSISLAFSLRKIKKGE